MSSKTDGLSIPTPILAPIPVYNGAGLLTLPPTSSPATSCYTRGICLSAGVTVFNWHRIRNNIVAAGLSSDAAKMDVEKIKNDISLTVATYYLQVLLSYQQIAIARTQMQQTLSQLDVVKKKE